MGDKTEPIRNRLSLKQDEETFMGLVFVIEPTSIDEAIIDSEWILFMQEELNQSIRRD